MGTESYTQNSADLSKLLEQLGSSTEWQRVVAATESPLPPPTTTLPAVLLSGPDATEEAGIKLDSDIAGGGVSESIMNLLKQLDSKPAEGSGPSRSEQAHQPLGSPIAAPNVEPPVDLHTMTFTQALPRITQLAQNQKVIEHLRKVGDSIAWPSWVNYSNRSRKSKTISNSDTGRSAKVSRKPNSLGRTKLGQGMHLCPVYRQHINGNCQGEHHRRFRSNGSQCECGIRGYLSTH
jgi:hypothetical protein